MDKITISIEEYERLLDAENERNAYRFVCGGKSPKELNEFFDKILLEQAEILEIQARIKTVLGMSDE